MRVDLQGDRRVGVAELARHEQDVMPLRDEDAGEGMAQHVEADALEAGFAAGELEPAVCHVALVGAGPDLRGEHDVLRPSPRRREPVLAQVRGELGHEDHVAARRRRLQPRPLTWARGLEADLDQAGLDVDVLPGQPEQLADPQAREDRRCDRQAVRVDRASSSCPISLRFRKRLRSPPGFGRSCGSSASDGLPGRP